MGLQRPEQQIDTVVWVDGPEYLKSDGGTEDTTTGL